MKNCTAETSGSLNSTTHVFNCKYVFISKTETEMAPSVTHLYVYSISSNPSYEKHIWSHFYMLILFYLLLHLFYDRITLDIFFYSFHMTLVAMVHVMIHSLLRHLAHFYWKTNLNPLETKISDVQRWDINSVMFTWKTWNVSSSSLLLFETYVFIELQFVLEEVHSWHKISLMCFLLFLCISVF